MDRCQGSLLEWKGKFGWISPDTPIEHPEARKHGGRVFLSGTDLGSVSEKSLIAGLRLSYNAYADGNGIGAGEVCLEEDDSETWHAPAHGAQPQGRGAPSPPGASWHVQRTIQKKPDAISPKGKTKGNGKWAAPASKLSAPKAKGGCKAPLAKSGTGPGFGGPNRSKTTHTGRCGSILWACSEMQGWRPAMEDAVVAQTAMDGPLESYALFGVFDGHGGAEVSRRVAQDLPGAIITAAQQATGESDIAQQSLEQALPVLDAKLREDGDGQVGMLQGMASGAPIVSDVKNAFGLMGSTAIVTLLEFDGAPAEGKPIRVVCANVGDSRAALCRGGEAVALSEDHKPDDPGERARIEGAGGFVAAVGPCQRVDGWGLNLSRASATSITRPGTTCLTISRRSWLCRTCVAKRSLKKTSSFSSAATAFLSSTALSLQ